MTCGIYRITERSTNLCYIGQSINIERRWTQHRRKWSKDLFDYEVLIECPPEHLDELEVFLIEELDSHRNGLNKTIGGTSIKVRYPSEETLKKLGESKKGNKYCLGRKISDENKAKLSEANKRPKSEEHRRKLSEALKGKKRPAFSKEWCENLSKSKKGRRRNT